MTHCVSGFTFIAMRLAREPTNSRLPICLVRRRFQALVVATCHAGVSTSTFFDDAARRAIAAVARCAADQGRVGIAAAVCERALVAVPRRVEEDGEGEDGDGGDGEGGEDGEDGGEHDEHVDEYDRTVTELAGEVVHDYGETPVQTTPDNVETEGLLYAAPRAMFVYIWLYCIGWWFVQDAAKVFTFHILHKHNLFDINNTGVVVLNQSTLDFMAESDAAKVSLLSAQDA